MIYYIRLGFDTNQNNEGKIWLVDDTFDSNPYFIDFAGAKLLVQSSCNH